MSNAGPLEQGLDYMAQLCDEGIFQGLKLIKINNSIIHAFLAHTRPRGGPLAKTERIWLVSIAWFTCAAI